MTKKLLVLFAAAFIGVTTLSADKMPDILKGTWILNEKASTEYMKTSPKWKPEDAKYLPMAMKRMGQVLYEFTDGGITATMRGKKQAMPPVVIKESSDKKVVFEMTAGKGKKIILTATITDAGNLNLRSSANNDGDYYLWKRGTLADKKGVSDEKLALEAVGTTMKSGGTAKKKTANTPKSPQKRSRFRKPVKATVVSRDSSQEEFAEICKSGTVKKLEIENGNKKISDLSPLAGLTSLENITIEDNKEITTLDFLKNCKQIKRVKVEGCSSLKDISALANLDQLQTLDIEETAVTDLSALKGKNKLTTLSISETAVSDLSPLKDCSSLLALDIRKTKVKDLSPLNNCKKIFSLRLSDSIPQAQIDKLKKEIPKVRVMVTKQ